MFCRDKPRFKFPISPALARAVFLNRFDDRIRMETLVANGSEMDEFDGS
jgi:hypothetical protein